MATCRWRIASLAWSAEQQRLCEKHPSVGSAFAPLLSEADDSS